MNLIDAIKSGKPFHKKGSQFWTDASANNHFTIQDILADDWEIEQEPREFWLCSNIFCETPHTTKLDAKLHRGSRDYEIIHVREVIE